MGSTIKINRQQQYKERLCRKVNDSSIVIWNSEWLNDDLQELIVNEPIIDEKVIDKIDRIIEPDEFMLFNY